MNKDEINHNGAYQCTHKQLKKSFVQLAAYLKCDIRQILVFKFSEGISPRPSQNKTKQNRHHFSNDEIVKKNDELGQCFHFGRTLVLCFINGGCHFNENNVNYEKKIGHSNEIGHFNVVRSSTVRFERPFECCLLGSHRNFGRIDEFGCIDEFGRVEKIDVIGQNSFCHCSEHQFEQPAKVARQSTGQKR